MENIDLSDNVKLEESCVIVDDNLLYEVARRNRKLRSYKKKIQDAFFAKKRLTKEYEQLAIWFGDLDDHDTMQRESSSSTTITLDPDPQTNSTQDSEWELLLQFFLDQIFVPSSPACPCIHHKWLYDRHIYTLDNWVMLIFNSRKTLSAFFMIWRREPEPQYGPSIGQDPWKQFSSLPGLHS
ncbi:hypothetical protein NC652_027968 [Populus alba x Populus x berolinensis]|nr:hypothetical protein NC652_027968 [Populus alba x Populus x berolinensis]